MTREIRDKQPLERAAKDLEFIAEQALECAPSRFISSREAREISLQQLHNVLLRIPDDSELNGLLEKYRGHNLSIFALLHCIAIESVLKGLQPTGLPYITTVTTRLLGKVPLPILRKELPEDTELTVAEIRRLLEE